MTCRPLCLDEQPQATNLTALNTGPKGNVHKKPAIAVLRGQHICRGVGALWVFSHLSWTFVESAQSFPGTLCPGEVVKTHGKAEPWQSRGRTRSRFKDRP